jgi:AcrR family transcriptional regulator
VSVIEEPSPVWLAVQQGSSRRLLIAALDSFSINGYHAATTRDIAKRAGMSPAALYVHYPSKGDLLYQLSRIAHLDALAEVERALEQDGPPEERTRGFVEAFARWHAQNHKVARVNQYELRALATEEYAEIGALRRRFGELLEKELRRGVRAKTFQVADVHGTTRAILSLGIDVARWYSPTGSSTPEDVGRLYGELSLRMVKAES